MNIVNVSSEINAFKPGMTQRHRILVVEDEILVSWSLVKSLSRNGFDVSVVETGEKAQELIGTNHYDLVITDVNLPSIDGFEVASYAKSIHPEIPIIVMSALAENSSKESALPLNIDRFVEKPFDIIEIIEIINGLLPRSGKLPR
jgi:two-component system, NtrC family, response regulator AtoC